MDGSPPSSDPGFDQAYQVGEWIVRPELNRLDGPPLPEENGSGRQESDGERPQEAPDETGQRVTLEPRVMAVLALLIKRAPGVASKDDLLAQVWENKFVGDEVLTNAIWNLRQVFGESARAPRYIETIRGKGYRLIADVTPLEPEASTVAAHKPASSHLAPNTLDETKVAAAAAAALEADDVTSTGAASARRTPVLPLPERNRSTTRRFAFGLLTLVALVTAMWWLSQRSSELDASTSSVTATQMGPTLLIAPFAEKSLRDEDVHLGTGFRHLVTRQLSQNPLLLVLTRAQADLVGAHSLEETLALARESGADFLIQGQVRRLGSSEREGPETSYEYSVSVFAATEPTQEPARSLSRVGAALALGPISSELTHEIQRRINILDLPEIHKQSSLDDVPAEALDLYLRAHHGVPRRFRGRSQAARWLQEATEIAPDFALALAALAETVPTHSGGQGYLANREAINRALEADEDLPEALVGLGRILASHEWRWQEAEAVFQRAISLNPSSGKAHGSYGRLLTLQGRFEQAEEMLTRAIYLTGRSPENRLHWLRYAYFSGDFPRAIRLAEEFLGDSSNRTLPKAFLALSWLALKEPERALETVDSDTVSRTSAWSLKGKALAQMGRIAEAEQMLEQLLDLDRVAYYQVAQVFCELGRYDEAVAALRSAFESRQLEISRIAVDPTLAPLRERDDFKQVVGFVGLSR